MIQKKKTKNQGDYLVDILKSSKETNGAYSVVKVTLYPGQGNDMHFHTTFTEQFDVVSGVLSLQVRKDRKHLTPGTSVLVETEVAHRFYNDSDDVTVFHCTMRPASTFEGVLRISSGLKEDGLTRPNGMPRNFWHLVVLFNLADTYLCALPFWLQRLVFGGLGRMAKWREIDRHLWHRYCGVNPGSDRPE